jgi:AcrR family transcriptional regulator
VLTCLLNSSDPVMDIHERILDAAMRVFAETGVRGATTRRIAAEAGVNEVTVFRHFGSKEKLISAAVDLAARQAELVRLPDPPGIPKEDLSIWCREHLLALTRVRSFLRTSMSEFENHPEVSRRGCSLPTRVASDLSRYIQQLKESEQADHSLDVPVATSAIMGILFADAVSRDIMPERYPYDLEHAAQAYARLFIRILNPPAN